MREASIPLVEAREKARQAYELGRDQATAELAADLRALAGEFARELRALRHEIRELLGLQTPIECTCEADGEHDADDQPLQ